MRLKKITLRSIAEMELLEKQKKAIVGGIDLPPVCVTNCSCQYATSIPLDNDPIPTIPSSYDMKNFLGARLTYKD